MNNFDDYPSVLLDGDKYKMLPFKSGIDLEEEILDDKFRNEDITYENSEYEDEQDNMDFLRGDLCEVCEESPDKSFKPTFGVPLFIEERYMEEEQNYRGSKYKEKKCDDNPRCIFERIQRCHPQIYKTLKRYGMNGMDAKKLIMRIIVLSIMYNEDR